MEREEEEGRSGAEMVEFARSLIVLEGAGVGCG
jgi:hypothetical protein